MIDITIEPLHDEQVSWYIDNIIIFSNSKQHIYELIEQVFQIMSDSRLYIKLAKLTRLYQYARPHN